jgi:cytochrome P450
LSEPRRARFRTRALETQTEEELDENFKPNELGIKDIISLWITQILQTYGDEESKDGAPVCEGSVDDLVGGPIFLALYPYFLKYGGVFKLAFGPKVFMVLSDPVIVREVLKEKPFAFSKGVLAEILEPIMGQGLIPAPYAVWKNRRRQLVPGFHKAWLDHMVGLFGDCSAELTKNLDKEIAAGGGVARVDMEERFCSVSLDIIGLAVFNYDFGSTTRESPIIKAVYTCLQEAAHRSTFYFPYWNIPFMTDIVPRQREFKANMALINETLNGLIAKAQKFEGTEDLEELQNRDYSKVNDPSLLRFLVDIRGADVTDTQLRDDLMTMLIAGHETTAAVLTWCLFCLAQDKKLMTEVRAEIDEVLGPAQAEEARAHRRTRRSTRLELTQAVPRRGAASVPRAAHPDPAVPGGRAVASKGAGENDVTLIKGMDVFISVWNLHRHPDCWEEPLKFDPKRFKRPVSKPRREGLGGVQPRAPVAQLSVPERSRQRLRVYPLRRRRAGSASATSSRCWRPPRASPMTLQRYEFELDKDAAEVGMEMGATIHTAGGLPMKVREERNGARRSS